jgi:hypothetical protein
MLPLEVVDPGGSLYILVLFVFILKITQRSVILFFYIFFAF